MLNLRYYVSYIQYGLLLPENTKTLFNSEEDFVSQLVPNECNCLIEKLHLALYRYFTAGAVLSREFLKPMYDAKEQDLEYFVELDNLIDGQDGHCDTMIRDLDSWGCWTNEEKDFSKGYPAYDFTESERWDECFGGFAEWMVGDARKKRKGDDAEVLRDVLRLIFVFGQMMDGGVVGDNGKSFWDVTRKGCTGEAQRWQAQEDYRRAREAGEDTEDWDSASDSSEDISIYISNRLVHPGTGYIALEDVDANFYDRAKAEQTNAEILREESEGQKDWKVTTRKLDLFDLGSFTPTIRTITSGPIFTKHTSCTRQEIKHLDYTERPNQPTIPDMEQFLAILHCMSGMPNHIETGIPDEYNFAPHPPLHLFTYMLRKYFGYQFADDAFEVKGTVGSYEAFVSNGRILFQDGGWSALLVSSEVKQNYVYEERKFSECVPPPGGW